MSKCDTCPNHGSCSQNEQGCNKVINEYSNIKHVIAVMSGKGGVGKSSMTVLLAKALVKQGYQVGILDADITGPSIPRLLNLSRENAYGRGNAIEPVVDKDGIKSISLNYLLDDENKPVIWRGSIINNAIKQFYRDVVWEDLDYLFIDMPPGTGDIALTVLQDLPVEGVVMISTPQDMVSMIVSKAINMCKEVDVPVYGVIENMAYINCPDCGKRIELYPNAHLDKFLADNNVELWNQLPMTSEVSTINKDHDFTSEQQKTIDELMKPIVEGLLNKTN